MRLRVSHPAMLSDLLAFIDRRGGIAVELTDQELDAGLVGSYGSSERMRLDLYLLVRAWEAGRLHSEGTVEILD
jgi:hypothetical protein